MIGRAEVGNFNQERRGAKGNAGAHSTEGRANRVGLGASKRLDPNRNLIFPKEKGDNLGQILAMIGKTGWREINRKWCPGKLASL